MVSVTVSDPKNKINFINVLVENSECMIALIDLNSSAKGALADGFCGSEIFLGSTSIKFEGLQFSEYLVCADTTKHTVIVTFVAHNAKRWNESRRIYKS